MGTSSPDTAAAGAFVATDASERAGLAGLARSLSETIGVDVAFYDPRGSLLAGSGSACRQDCAVPDGEERATCGPAATRGVPVPEAGGPPCRCGVAELVRSAAESGCERVEVMAGRVVAVWPIRRRGRTRLVAVAQVTGEASPGARSLLKAAGEGVRARLGLADARAETDSLSEALSQSYEEVSLLHGLAEVLRVTQPIGEMLGSACSELRACIDAEAVAAWVPGAETSRARSAAGSERSRAGREATSEGPAVIVSGRLPFDPADLPRLVEDVLDATGGDRHLVINNRCQDVPALAALSIALDRLVLVPLPVGDGVMGALVAVNRAEPEFGSPDAKLVRSVALEAAVFIENHRLYHDLQDLMLDLVRALVSSIDAKDPYTCGHSERVAITCRELARRLGLPEERVEEAYLAGLLHDIGKIGTPESILLKEGRLEPEERGIINQHPAVGARILSTVKHLQPIREAVLHHHEWVDGSGYPAGLVGEEVPLLARIVGLADAFDAMTSNRPYRPMLPLEYVLKEIERHVGRQFDVRVAEALLSLDVGRLMQQFVDRQASAAPRPVPV